MGCPAFDFPELKEGNVREKNLEEIWMTGFQKFREIDTSTLPEMCRKCQYLKICRGGCWTQRINGGRFCNLDVCSEVVKEMANKKEVRHEKSFLPLFYNNFC